MLFSRIPKPVLLGLAASGALAALSAYAVHELSHPPLLEIHIFALKSGNSLFIRTPDDHRIIIGGGANSEVIRSLTRILPFYDRHIDTVIVPDTDPKQVTGLIDVIDRYAVSQIYVPAFTLENVGVASTTDIAYQTFIEDARVRNVPVVSIRAGDELVLGGGDTTGTEDEAHGMTFEITKIKFFFPIQPSVFEYSKASSPRILFRISFGNTHFMYSGDASKKIQKFISVYEHMSLNNTSIHPRLDSDVLITSNAASSADMSPEFLRAVHPKTLIYSKIADRVAYKKDTRPLRSKAASSSTLNLTKKSITKKKNTDPFPAILSDRRFNLKELGTIKITSDAEVIHIAPWD